MNSLHLYSRQGCHLCERMIDELSPLIRGKLDLVVHDVDARSDWQRKYGLRIPVLEYDGEPVCQYHLDPDALAQVLGKQST